MNGILGLEHPVEFTMNNLFDPTMAQMVLNAQNSYISALKEDYKDFLDEQKQLLKEYGDFFSYFPGANQAWHNATRGKLNTVYDDLLKRGIDPVRSVEGRAEMRRAARGIDMGYLSRLKADAEIGKEYIKNMSELLKNDMFDLDFEDFASRLQQGTTFREYQTTPDGRQWTRMSPTQYKTLFLATYDSFKGMDDTFLGTKDGYDYSGISSERIKKVATDLVNSGWGDNNIYGKYYKEKAKARVADPKNDAEVNNLLINDIVALHEGWRVRNSRKANDYDKMQKEHNYKIAEQNNSFNHQVKLTQLSHDLSDRNDYRSHKRRMEEKNNTSNGAVNVWYAGIWNAAKGTNAKHVNKAGIEEFNGTSSAIVKKGLKEKNVDNFFSKTGRYTTTIGYDQIKGLGSANANELVSKSFIKYNIVSYGNHHGILQSKVSGTVVNKGNKDKNKANTFTPTGYVHTLPMSYKSGTGQVLQFAEYVNEYGDIGYKPLGSTAVGSITTNGKRFIKVEGGRYATPDPNGKYRLKNKKGRFALSDTPYDIIDIPDDQGNATYPANLLEIN